jgi:hypothetical protein
MNRFQSKQIDRILAGKVRTNNFPSTAAATANVTAAISTAIGITGYAGVFATLVESTADNVVGFITSGNNHCEIFDAVTRKKLIDATGNEIFGRLTQLAGTYTINYFSQIAGVDTAYTFAATTNIDIEFPYRFSLWTYPTDSLLATTATNINQDPNGGNGKQYWEVVTPGVNTLSTITRPVITSSPVIYVINGQSVFAGSPANSSVVLGVNPTGIITTSGGVATVDPIALAFNIAATDDVKVTYYSFA